MLKLLFVITLLFGANSFAVEENQYAGSNEISTQSLHHPPYTYFDWGRGQNGWGYCYEFTSQGYVLNQGRPVHNANCEAVRPSYFDWGRGMDGYVYCYQWTPYRVAMNEGRPMHPSYCRY